MIKITSEEIGYIIVFLICCGFGLSLLPTDQETIDSLCDLNLAFMVIFTLSGSLLITIGIVETFKFIKKKIG